MLIKLQGGGRVIRTNVINDIWVDLGNKIMARTADEHEPIYMAAYYQHPGRAEVVFDAIIDAMKQPPESYEMLILPEDTKTGTWLVDREEADNDTVLPIL